MAADAAALVQAADWIGRHALLVFGALLLLLPAAAGAVSGWLRGRSGALPPGGRPTSTLGARRPAALIGLGITMAVLCAAVFLALATQLAAGGTLSRVDQALLDALQAHLPPALLPAFAAVTHLADAATRTLLGIGVALLLLVRQQPALAAGWVVALAGNGWLTRGLKHLYGRPRPVFQDGFGIEQGLSFPSGHSAGAVVMFGMLAYLACCLLPLRWQRTVLVMAVALALAVGASRVFLGVHFASDVIAGFLSGGVWLLLCIGGVALWRAWRGRPA